MNYYKLNENKEPVACTLTEFGEFFEDMDNRRVKLDEFIHNGRRLFLSTVFLGTPHVGGMFETMLFDQAPKYMSRNSIGRELDCVRTDTWHEAELAHEAMLLRVKDNNYDDA